ncbi:MAG TPA: hypothetical protein H9898_08670 [Candidatus Anaerobiospirillum stercoravium]|nr:hypothetical protein [Candidatus Anaerobiospirillum stercoravium]
MTQILSSGVAARNQATDDTTTETTLHLGATAPQHPERADYHSPSSFAEPQRVSTDISDLENKITISKRFCLAATAVFIYMQWSAQNAFYDWQLYSGLICAFICLCVMVGSWCNIFRLRKLIALKYEAYEASYHESIALTTSLQDQLANLRKRAPREHELELLELELIKARTENTILKTQLLKAKLGHTVSLSANSLKV